MIVICPSCASRFQYGDERFQGAKSKRFRCPKCAHTFEVDNPALAAPVQPGPTPQGPAAPVPAPPAPRPAPPPPPPPLPPPPPPKATETSRRKGRDGMLTGTGFRKRDGMPHGLRFSLAFLSGPLASTVRVLETPVTVIGREEGDVVINDPEISRRHARIEIHPDGEAWLTDLGSTNGTQVGGALISEAVRLQDRMEFSCGRSTFMLLIRDTDAIGLD